MQAKPSACLPQRHLLLAHLTNRLGAEFPPSTHFVLHYLSGKVDAEILLVDEETDMTAMQRACIQIATDDKYFRSIQIYRRSAPN
jgi:hypothetical protein